MLSRILSAAVVLGLVFGVSGVSDAQVGGCTALTLISTADRPGLETAVALDDGWALVAPPLDGPIRLFDINDAGLPMERSSIMVSGWINAMAIDEGIVALSLDDDGPSYGDLLIYDWTNPGSPVLASRLDSSAQNGVISIAIVGDRLFLTNSEAFFEFDISDPYDPQWAASKAIESGTDIAIQDGYAFVTATGGVDQGLYILDIRTRGRIVERSFLPLPGIVVWEVAVGDRFAAVTIDIQEVLAVDISDLSNPAVASVVTSPQSIVSIGARFNALYIGEGNTGGLHVYDLSESSSPQWIDVHDPPTEPWDVAAIQGVIAVADRQSGLRLFQMSDCSGCRPDFAEPAGVLDFFDVQAFLSAFMTEGRAADLDVNAVWDVRDVLLYLEAFSAGCP